MRIRALLSDTNDVVSNASKRSMNNKNYERETILN